MSDQLRYWAESNHCPAGFDCAFLNSCPSFTQPCPPGFFCGTYESNMHRKYLDYKYADWATRGISGAEFTMENAGALYAEPGRYIQNFCLSGFYCPDGDTMLPCGVGNWCPQRTVKPMKCDSLSACPTQFASYQVNFVNVVIMGCLTILVLVVSVSLLFRQQATEKRTRKEKPSFSYEEPATSHAVLTGPEDVASGKMLAPKPAGYGRGIGFTFNSLLVEATRIVQLDDGYTKTEQFAILPEISGSIRPGSVTCILGPTGCGKSTLLNMLRVGGDGRSAGTVDVKLFRGNSASGVDVEGYKPIGEPLSDKTVLKTRIGLVPQDEILDRALTVRELLTLNARARRGLATSNHSQHAEDSAEDSAVDIDSLVEKVLSDLSIRHIGDTVIGGSRETQAAANISGGQLKRVNIACELVALSHPAALLLDEPTSGLDASIAYDLIESLESIASTGITVLMALQQPRPEIFARMDRVILMLSGGHIIFDGPPNQAAPYLQSKGFDQSPEASDADFCIDVLNGLVTPELYGLEEEGGVGIGIDSLDRRTLTAAGPVTAQEHLDYLAKQWRRLSSDRLAELSDQSVSESVHRHSNRENNPPRTSIIPITDGDGSKGSKKEPAGVNASPAATAGGGGGGALPSDKHNYDGVKGQQISWDQVTRFLFLTWLNFKRCLIVRFRAKSSLVVYAFIHVVMATALSSGFSIFIQNSYLNIFTPPTSSALQDYFPSVIKNHAHRNAEDLGFQQLLFFMSTALGCASSLAAVPLFSGQLELVRREASSGMSVVAYAVGRLTGDIFFTLWNASIFAGVWLLFGHAGSWHKWLAVIVCTAFAASGIGHVCAVSTRPGSASFTAIIITYIFCVFSGVEPKLTQVAHLPVVNWIWYISFATWTAEATYHTWSEYLSNDGNIPNRGMIDLGAKSYGFSVRTINHAVGSLLAIGFAFRIIAVIVLVQRAKSRGYSSPKIPSTSASASSQ